MENPLIQLEQSVSGKGAVDRKASHTVKAATAGRAKGVRTDERGPRMMGRITRIFYGQSHGFILADDQRQLFFHRRDVRTALFNALAVGDRVAFEVIEDKFAGPRAVKVKRGAGEKDGTIGHTRVESHTIDHH